MNRIILSSKEFGDDVFLVLSWGGEDGMFTITDYCGGDSWSAPNGAELLAMVPHELRKAVRELLAEVDSNL